MDSVKIVKLTNRVAFFAVGLLAYWVFVFVSIKVFGFKVFRENITEAFYMSILGVFALLGGAIILNIMLNMTRISESLEHRDSNVTTPGKTHKKWIVAAIACFPVIFLLLLLGDYSSSVKKRNHLVDTAKSLTSEHKDSINQLAKYSFTAEYIEKTSDILKVLTKVEEKFPQIDVIVQDNIDSNTVFLAFRHWHSRDRENEYKKVNFIYSASNSEREYLRNVFNNNESKVKFSAHDGNYELYFPIKTQSGTVVLYLSDYQRYGKYGS